jgi:hypothetical protein
MSMICELFIVPDQSARQVLGNPAEIHQLLESLEGSDAVLSLEKSWHGLHFVLAGTTSGGDPPLNFLMGGGVPVGDEDVGYGPARVLDPVGVAEFDKALEAISDADFARRFDPAELTGALIYPMIWDEPLDELMQEYRSYFQEMKRHVHRATQSRQALILTIR